MAVIVFEFGPANSLYLQDQGTIRPPNAVFARFEAAPSALVYPTLWSRAATGRHLGKNQPHRANPTNAIAPLISDRLRN